MVESAGRTAAAAGSVSSDMQTPLKGAMKSFAPSTAQEALLERAVADFF
jgi:hypothetical protein